MHPVKVNTLRDNIISS